MPAAPEAEIRIPLYGPSGSAGSRSKNAGIELVHHVDGCRARFRVADLRRNPALGLVLHAALSQLRGVTRVSFSTATGSLLIHHSPELKIEKAQAKIREQVRRFWAQLDEGTLRTARTQLRLARSGRNPRQSGAPLPSTRPEVSWHALGIGDVLARLGSGVETGLTSVAAESLLGTEGANRLGEAEPDTGMELFLNQFKNPAVSVLVGSALLSIATGAASEAIVLGVVILGNAYIGFRMEYQANRSLSILARMASTDITVIRDGARKVIPAELLVDGDILALQSGVNVPADARILHCTDLTVDESPLTGESESVEKTAEALNTGGARLSERRNMLYRGTLIMTGNCLAVAVATGPRTEIGRIQRLVSEIEPPRTHLQEQLEELTQQLLKITALATASVFGVGMLRGRSTLQMLDVSISLIITAIPEGLTTVATTALAQAALSVRKDNVLVRKLDSIEALGATQVLCLDKTGTLTLNQMKVVSVTAGLVRLEGAELPRVSEDLRQLLEVAILCNDAQLVPGEKKPELTGSATETALLELAMGHGLDVPATHEAAPRTRTQLRTNCCQIMSTLHRRGDGSRFLAIKGNPDQVLVLCSHYLRDGERVPLTPEDRVRFARENERMSDRALRVLGLASLDSANQAINEEDLHSNTGLTWLGLTGMRDQIREGMAELLASLREAGVELRMITGDQGATAAAIARDLAFSGQSELRVLDGSQWETLSDAERSIAVASHHIFARINPSQKLEIVQTLKANGKVVAMVGDGINDAAALHIADVGISIGKNGTQVSREVANMVLMDDDLRSLLPAIRAGRANHDNINKAVNFLLATNLSETLILAGSVILGFDSPLSAIQLLWINLISDVFPALALAMDPPAEDILRHPPPSRDERLITREDFRSLAGEAAGMALGNLVAYGYGFVKYGASPAAQTLAFLNLNASQVLHTISASTKGRISQRGKRALPNPYVKLSVLTGFGLEAVSLLIPFVRSVLGNTRMDAADFGIGGGLAAVNFAVNQAIIRLRAEQRHGGDPCHVCEEQPVVAETY